MAPSSLFQFPSSLSSFCSTRKRMEGGRRGRGGWFQGSASAERVRLDCCLRLLHCVLRGAAEDKAAGCGQTAVEQQMIMAWTSSSKPLDAAQSGSTKGVTPAALRTFSPPSLASVLALHLQRDNEDGAIITGLIMSRVPVWIFSSLLRWANDLWVLLLLLRVLNADTVRAGERRGRFQGLKSKCEVQSGERNSCVRQVQPFSSLLSAAAFQRR